MIVIEKLSFCTYRLSQYQIQSVTTCISHQKYSTNLRH